MRTTKRRSKKGIRNLTKIGGEGERENERLSFYSISFFMVFDFGFDLVLGTGNVVADLDCEIFNKESC